MGEDDMATERQEPEQPAALQFGPYETPEEIDSALRKTPHEILTIDG